MADDNDKNGTGDGPSADEIEKMKAALEKANKEAAKYRHEAKAKDEELEELRKAQDSSKSEMDKVKEQLSELSKRAEEAEAKSLRAEVAQAKNLTPAQAKRLQGSTREELEADADELLEAFQPASSSEDEEEEGESSEDGSKAEEGGRSRPKEKLTGGASNEGADGESDPDKIAEKILSRTHI